MTKKKQAWLNWSREQEAWVLRLWIDEEWTFSKSWSVRNYGEDEEGTEIDFVRDSVLCEIAHLQDLGYEVKVTC